MKNSQNSLNGPAKVTARRKHGATALSYGLVVGLIAIVSLATITELGGSVEQLFGDVSSNLETGASAGQGASAAPSASAAAVLRTSCLDILQNSESTGDGTYTVDPTGSDSFSVHCDMTTDGGGWTLVNHRLAAPADSIVTTTVTPSTPSTAVTAARWQALRDAGSEMLTTEASGANPLRLNIASALSANCLPLVNDISASHLIQSENSGCAGSGLDYCYLGSNEPNRRTLITRICSSGNDFWQDTPPIFPYDPATLLIYVR
ncbi:MAG: hypothetical protein Alpg2KO_22150 [Alphaproteobacteria bacterium]